MTPTEPGFYWACHKDARDTTAVFIVSLEGEAPFLKVVEIFNLFGLYTTILDHKQLKFGPKVVIPRI